MDDGEHSGLEQQRIQRSHQEDAETDEAGHSVEKWLSDESTPGRHECLNCGSFRSHNASVDRNKGSGPGEREERNKSRTKRKEVWSTQEFMAC
jgi:hypothetical protein